MEYQQDRIDALPEMVELLADFGERWQIAYDYEVCAIVAVRRPTATALHIHVAGNPAELRAKLLKAENE